MTYPRLNNSPILEAVMGISISENEHWQAYYKEVVELIKEDYTVINERVSFRVRGKILPVEGNFEHVNDSQVIKDGYVLSNPNTRKSVLLKPDSIQITKRAPYIEWYDLFDDFKKVVNALEKVAPSLLFLKPYLKYRNRFSVSMSNDALDEYFTISHSVPSILTIFTISNLNFNADMTEEQFDYKIEQNLKPSENETNDIDVSINVEVVDTSITTKKINDLFSSVENLREKKNQVFFSLITDKAKQLFK